MATVATVRVATDDVMLVRARRAVPLASSTLNCKTTRDLRNKPALSYKLTLSLAVVDSAVAVVLPHLKCILDRATKATTMWTLTEP